MMIGDIWLSEGTVEPMAATCHVSKVTIRNWMKKGEIPPAQYALLDLVENGNLGRIHEHWDGWKINTRNGDLVTPIVYRAAQRTYASKDIYNMQITYQQLSDLRSTNAELAAKNEGQELQLRELKQRCDEQQKVIELLEQRLAFVQGHDRADPHPNVAAVAAPGLGNFAPRKQDA